jgi:hypothetical protein
MGILPLLRSSYLERVRQKLEGKRQACGGERYPILPFPEEISYRCFITGSQKYFRGPVKSSYDVLL